MSRYRTARAVLLLAAAALGVRCLSVTEPRAERDLEVGRHQVDDTEFTVRDGLAAVRRVAGDQIDLWSSAPSFELRIEVAAGGRADWLLAVQNCMPDAVLRVLEGAVTVTEEAEPIATRRRFRLQLPEGQSVIAVGPADAAGAEPFRFALLSDVQEAIDSIQDIFAKINQDPSIEFLLGAGDLTERGTHDELLRYQRELLALRVPYYTTLGNHELGRTPTLWHDYFGRASFHFVFHDTHFSLLDSGSAMIDPMVLGWLDGWLEQASDRVHIVAMHIPPIDPIGVRNGSFASRNEAAALLAKLAAGNVDLTLYGHIHSYYAFENAGIPARVSGGGGAIPERFDGIGRHFLTIDVDPLDGRATTRLVKVD
jgi:predicted phosphodiesterase